MINSANHFIKIVDCVTVRVDGLLLEAPHESPNTDGINFYGGFDQSFSDSHVSNGDDCVSIVTTGDTEGACVAQPDLCQGGNVVVENILCEGGHGASIGSVRHGVVTNVSFTNLTLTREPTSTQTRYAGGGIRIKTYPNGSLLSRPHRTQNSQHLREKVMKCRRGVHE